MLKIADGLSLPRDAVTQTFAILAKRRVGKSCTARRFAEELLLADQQIVILDPKGDWWGIRSSADGKAPGFPVIVLGGEHGDLPLEVNAAEVVANLVIKERVSILLDLSGLRKNEVARFMGGHEGRGNQGFLEAIYRLKAREEFRSPMMLIVDEADAIAPQKPFKGEEWMLGAIEDIVRRGGQRGIGCMSVTQRSAVLNKNVLTQSQVLIAMRTIAPQDLKAMQEWIDVHGTTEERAVLMDSLPSLPRGDAWFWSPGWPGEKGIFERVHVDPIRTFDSGATPEPGKKRIAPKNLADIDLGALQRQMAETIEKAKADDPKELRRQLTEQSKRIRELERAPQAKPVDPEAEQQRLQSAVEKAVKPALDAQKKHFQSQVQEFSKGVRELIDRTFSANGFHPPPIEVPKQAAIVLPWVVPHVPSQQPSTPRLSSSGSPGWKRMLIALAQRNGLSARQLGLRAGVSSKSGTFRTYLSSLRKDGLIEGSGDSITITEAGRNSLGSYDPLPTGPELLRHWQNELGSGSGAARILQALAKASKPLSHEEIGELAGLSHKSGTYGTYLSKLRTLELIQGSREITLSEELQ